MRQSFTDKEGMVRKALWRSDNLEHRAENLNQPDALSFLFPHRIDLKTGSHFSADALNGF